MRSPTDELTISAVEDEVKRLLLVEGPTDVGFFEAMLVANRRGRVRVHSLEGKSSLSDKVRAQVQAPGYKSLEWLGIVIDGDDDPNGRRIESLKPRFDPSTQIGFLFPLEHGVELHGSERPGP